MDNMELTHDYATPRRTKSKKKYQEPPRAAVMIYSLGGFQVTLNTDGSSEPKLNGRMPKLLIKLMISRATQAVSRKQICDMLLSGISQDQQRVKLNSALYRMKKCLSAGPSRDPFIQNSRDIVEFNRETVWSDVAEFRRLVKALKEIEKTATPGRIIARCEEALNLYRGDFLPEDTSLPWTTTPREKLRADCHYLLELAAKLAESEGKREKAIGFYERLFTSDSTDQKVCRWLMQTHYIAGDRGKAVRTFERCERELSLRMNLEPDDETRIMFRSIITHC